MVARPISVKWSKLSRDCAKPRASIHFYAPLKISPIRGFAFNFHAICYLLFMASLHLLNSRRPLVCLLAATSLLVFPGVPAQGQATSVKRISKQIPGGTDPENPAPKPGPGQPGKPPGPKPAAPRPPAAVPVAAPAPPEKTDAEKEEQIRKVVDFQKKRAEAGSPSSQYDLGMRYLDGNGVEKDLDLARKWLGEAAKNGSETAAKKLAEIDAKK